MEYGPKRSQWTVVFYNKIEKNRLEIWKVLSVAQHSHHSGLSDGDAAEMHFRAQNLLPIIFFYSAAC